MKITSDSPASIAPASIAPASIARETAKCIKCEEEKYLFQFASNDRGYRDKTCRKCRNYFNKLRKISRADYFEKINHERGRFRL